jgi:hypothetical protein
MEFAVYAQNDYKADDFEAVREINELEQYLREIPYLQSIASITTVYKTIHQMFNGTDAYQLPETKAQFARYQQMADKIPNTNVNILISKDEKKARITSRIADVGADTIKQVGQRIDDWIVNNVDTSIIQVTRTGTGLIIDKNAEYVRRSILMGLGGAMLIVSFLMVLLFQNLRLLLMSLVLSVIPL